MTACTTFLTLNLTGKNEERLADKQKETAGGEAIFASIGFSEPGLFTAEIIGEGLTPATTQFVVALDADKSGLLDRETEKGVVQIRILENSLEDDVVIEIYTYQDISDENVSLKAKIDAANNEAKQSKSMFYNKDLVEGSLSGFMLTDMYGMKIEESVTLSPDETPALIAIPFKDVDGAVDGTEIRVGELEAFYLNEKDKKWEIIPVSWSGKLTDLWGNVIGGDVIYFETYHLSVYSLMGGIVPGGLEIKDITNYPNPFSDSTTFIFNLIADADEVSIRIYTVAGRLIKTMSLGDLSYGHYEQGWDGKDGEGKELANGIYFYKITAKKGKSKAEATGKLLIIR